ncbi:MAG: hypothetical protein U0T77_08450 [Chitinophagales bacterium]
MNHKQRDTSHNHTRHLAAVFLFLMVFQLFSPAVSYALTSGPTQPEVQGFTQYGTTDIVDPFSGSFSYNIPLLEIPGPDGGYPINLSYSSGISMDQEASWVGLGWNLNVGVINREMRGLPDDFDGDIIRNKKYMKPNITIGAGVTIGAEAEFAGVPVKDILSFSASKGIKLYYNNYNGFGVTQEGGFSIGANKNGIGASLGLSMSQDNIEGGKVSPTLGLSYSKTKGDATVGGGLQIGMNFSSRYGLQGVSLGMNVSRTIEYASTKAKNKKSPLSKKEGYKNSQSLSLLSTSLSYAGAAQSPRINDEMKSMGFNASLQLGGQLMVANIDGEINGFWNKEELAHNNEWVENEGFGFNYLQHVKEDNQLMDFQRSLDQPVGPDVKTIAQPILNYDIYSVKGQGIGAMLRPFRSDIGMLRDDVKESDGWNASLAVEIAGGNLFHAGGSGFGGITQSSSGDWSRNADIHDLFKYKESVTGNPYFEPVTYQSYGEIHALDKSETENLLQGFKPTYLNIGPNAITGGDFSILKQVAGRSASGVFVKYPTVNTSGKRIPRNISIQHFTNEQLNVEDNILKQFDIKYTTNVNESYNLNELNKLVNRDALPPRQTGGFEAVNTSGLRYIYGMPAYNLSSTECTYSAAKISGNEYKVDCIDNGSGDPVAAPAGYEDYLEKEELPAYAHSYLLTSVLGSDYIDMDDNGVSDKDLGYWVKFNYLKTNGNESEGLKPYNWRAPYKGGNYNEKLQSKDRDDVGTYTFGKRENFYVTSIETKTHVAEFYLSPRHDARGAEKEIQSLNFNPSNAASSYKLDSIRLFTKPERYDANGAIIPNAIPIKTVHFEYANYPGRYASAKELCKGPDNAAANTGKLTLKSVWFSYRNNAKGKDNNYVFDYHEGLNNENPDYNPFDYNRWGDYQPNDPDYCENKYFPYTRQDLPKAEIDRRAAVWNLKEIELPTGASMKINYEANDYAYVQNKPAMQMYKIASVGNTDGIGHAQQLYNWNSDSVYFELPATVSSLTEAKNTVKNYLDNTGQLYFKTKVDLTARGDWEYVSGYCKIDNIVAVQVGSKYYGGIHLIPQSVNKIGGRNVHPFAISAWNYLLMNRPEIIEGNNVIRGNPESTNKSELIGTIVEVLMTSLFTIFPIVQNYYKQAVSEGFGVKTDLEHSFIRLNNVTGAKYGGGARVKSIDLISKNINNQMDTLGTVYDYTTLNEKGKRISSGVAAYEPLIGGDENALKRAMFYENKVAMRNYIPTFSELPLNENYFPAPSVGYSKVTIRSRASDMVANAILPATIPTTGQTVQEFYTAKDYPTLTDYTPLVKAGSSPGNLYHYTSQIPIPIIGTFMDEQLSISHGFNVELNDMHGKPKATYTYGQNNEGKMLDSMPISYEKYVYKSENILYNGSFAKKLSNEAKVMYNEETVQNKLLGVDYEYFGDARESSSSNTTFGMRVNVDVFLVAFPIGIASLLPTVGEESKGVRLAANNKIIHRFGIVDSIIRFNEGSLVKTSNELYDAYTGNPVLTKLNDEYGNNTFNYTIPAYWKYDGMGPAYQNSSLSFQAKVDSQHVDTKYIGLKIQDLQVFENLSIGDELAIDNGANFYAVGYLIQVDKNTNTIWIDTKAIYDVELVKDGELLDCKIIRSGRKNMLSVPAGTIISKTNPVTNRTNYECK